MQHLIEAAAGRAGAGVSLESSNPKLRDELKEADGRQRNWSRLPGLGSNNQPAEMGLKVQANMEFGRSGGAMAQPPDRADAFSAGGASQRWRHQAGSRTPWWCWVKEHNKRRSNHWVVAAEHPAAPGRRKDAEEAQKRGPLIAEA